MRDKLCTYLFSRKQNKREHICTYLFSLFFVYISGSNSGTCVGWLALEIKCVGWGRRGLGRRAEHAQEHSSRRYNCYRFRFISRRDVHDRNATQRGNERAQTADWANERCDTLRPIYVARIPGPHFMECNTNNTTHARSTVGSVVSIQSQSGKVRIAPSVDM